MTPNVTDLLDDAVREALASAGLPGVDDVLWEVPREASHGDYACNVAMALARAARRPPRQVAETIVRHFPQGGLVDRDYWYNELMSLPISNNQCTTEPMDAEDMLFILYTSGTTGRPKGIVHTHGGYMVYTHTTLKYVFDIKNDDRYWCAADPGWITGHSYIVYAPLLTAATSFMYEGAPNHPYPNRWWQMVEKYGITILYAAPTAIRGLMRFGNAWANRHDLSSLRLLGSVGEPINPEAWRWYYTVIGKERCPI